MHGIEKERKKESDGGRTCERKSVEEGGTKGGRMHVEVGGMRLPLLSLSLSF